MCLYPKLIKNRKYTVNKKNGGNVPVLHDERIAMVPVGCGKCIECKKQRANQWMTRLNQEKRHNKEKSYFVTFTMSEINKSKFEKLAYEKSEGVEIPWYTLQNEIATIAIRRFLERVRKKNKKSIKHWFVTELGEEKGRIHIHGFIWTDKKELLDKWDYGWKKILPMMEGGIGYVVKYIFKSSIKYKDYQPKILTSPGIGKDYINTYDAKNNKYNKEETREVIRLPNGNKIGLPIYYRNNIYTEEEKEKLWLNKLDKGERWVLGKKIDIKTDEGLEKYYKILKQAQRKNVKLGYGGEKEEEEHITQYKNSMKELRELNKAARAAVHERRTQ